MPYYQKILYKTEEGKRTAEGLLRLKPALDLSIPPKCMDKTLLLATWNIREFGNNKSGGREAEPLYYLAEIISHFDLVAVEEVRDNLDALDFLMYVLGPGWKYLVSDVTLGAQGNNERLAFIYDSHKITFGGLAGELMPKVKKSNSQLSTEFAFARSPYLVGFQAGWFKFTICAQHLYYGESKADDPQRVAEAKAVTELMNERMKSPDRWANNAILLGDFNIFTTQDKTFLALSEGKFHIPEELQGKYTNANRDKPFDQIAFLAPDVERQISKAKGGVFPFFDYVYRDSEKDVYCKDKTAQEYQEWRTYKMSDHLPLWVELGVDFGVDYLTRKMNAA